MDFSKLAHLPRLVAWAMWNSTTGFPFLTSSPWRGSIYNLITAWHFWCVWLSHKNSIWQKKVECLLFCGSPAEQWSIALHPCFLPTTKYFLFLETIYEMVKDAAWHQYVEKCLNSWMKDSSSLLCQFSEWREGLLRVWEIAHHFLIIKKQVILEFFYKS